MPDPPKPLTRSTRRSLCLLPCWPKPRFPRRSARSFQPLLDRIRRLARPERCLRPAACRQLTGSRACLRSAASCSRMFSIVWSPSGSDGSGSATRCTSMLPPFGMPSRTSRSASANGAPCVTHGFARTSGKCSVWWGWHHRSIRMACRFSTVDCSPVQWQIDRVPDAPARPVTSSTPTGRAHPRGKAVMNAVEELAKARGIVGYRCSTSATRPRSTSWR
jgi:hypothetical protein